MILLLFAPLVLIRIGEEVYYASLEREKKRVIGAFKREEAARAHDRRLAEIKFATEMMIERLDEIATDAGSVTIEGVSRPVLPPGEED